MRDGMRKNVKPYSPAEDVIWWKMDDNHHQSLQSTLLKMQLKNRAELEQFRKNSSNVYSIKMIDETMGPVVANSQNFRSTLCF